MLTAEGISISYGGKCVLHNVSFSLEQGETLSVVGPSGCGKTSLLYALCGLQPATSGSVNLLGGVVQAPRADVPIILQDYGLLPWMTNLDNVALGLKLGGISKGKRHALARKQLAHFGLEGREDEYPSNLSGGEQQRVAIARAFVLEPSALLLDEPFSALDALTREHLQKTLLDVWRMKQIPFVLVTHSLDEAVYLGQRILVLGDCPARPVAVLENPVFGHEDARSCEDFFALVKQLRTLIDEQWENSCER
ncbi:MAG: ABC transporter ATP-binding protein [Desulfovibrio sp.]